MEASDMRTRMKRRSAPGEGQQPIQVITVGAVSASIYLRQAPSGYAYYAYHLKRSYRSLTSGNAIHSTDFFVDNQADLVAVIAQASQWIAEQSKCATSAH
jgi:hypothetical protein